MLKKAKKYGKYLFKNKLLKCIKKTVVIGGLEQQRVPITAFNLSCLHRDVRFVGDTEIYAPSARQAHIDGGSQMRFHLHKQIIPSPYYFIADETIVYGKTVWESGMGIPLECFPEMKVQSIDTQVSVRDYLKIRSFAITNKAHNVDYGFMLTHAYSNNYFHFIMDGLLKLVIVFSLPQSVISNLTFIISSRQDLKKWQKDYLNILGIDLEQCLFVEQEPIRVKKLLIVSPRRFQFYYSIDVVRKFSQLMLENLGYSNRNPEEYVYISRSSSKTRHVENEQELIDRLSQFGFRLYTLENMSVAEQVRLFTKAKVIIAPHGAGLTNMIYCKQPKVIEIFGEDNYNQGFFMTLCLGLGGKYTAIVASKIYANGNLEVDIESVVSKVKSYI